MSNHDGITVPSETYRAHDQGTDWPPDAFTHAVMSAETGAAISTPATSSYASDGNMEAFDAMLPYATRGEAETNPARYTGAVGPAGRSTPQDHPELTAP
jgi:hypothetical protein